MKENRLYYSLEKMLKEKFGIGRKVPVEFIVQPYGGGWEDYHIKIHGRETTLYTSTLTGEWLNDLMRNLCLFNKVFYKYDYYSDGMYCFEEFEYEDFEDSDSYMRIPTEERFEWDGETKTMYWTISKGGKRGKDDFNLDILIERDFWLDEEKDKFYMNVSYKDFCYAVAKGVTEALKKHGLLGWSQSAYGQELKWRYLLFLKAYALGLLDKLEVDFKQPDGVGPISNFEEEMKILLMDME